MTPTRTTIAVVEDDAGVRTALAQLLRAAGTLAVTFASAEEFLRAEPAPSFDCVIADVNLPGMSGVGLLTSLSTDRGHVAAILITGRDDPATLELMRQFTHVPCLHKPFSDEALFGAIRTVLGA